MHQKFHRDFQPNELATANSQWYIAFLPMQKSWIEIKVQHNEKDTFFNVPFKTGVLMNVKTVHAGGYCNDKEEGNLRMQIHISLDRKHAPLPTIIVQQHLTENYHEKEFKEVSL